MFSEFENEFISLKVENGILHFAYKPIKKLDLLTVQKIVGDRLSYQQGLYFPVLCDTRGIQASEKAARNYLAKQGSSYAKAVAILDDRNVSRAMHRIYIRKNQPMIPTKVFSDYDEALFFLMQFV